MARVKTEFAPMLAVKAELDKIVYPILASPKFDGVRVVTRRGAGALCRSLLSVPNEHIRMQLEAFVDLDGEVVVGPPTAKDVFNRSQSGVMTAEGFPQFTFYVFDHLGMSEQPFWKRLAAIKMRATSFPGYIVPVEHVTIHNEEQLLAYSQSCLDAGYEGAMLRAIDGPYKYGRSTLKQGWLLKVKNFVDAEAEIVGFEELMVNDNPPTINALGLQERSSHKENLRPGGKLGSLIAEMVWPDTGPCEDEGCPHFRTPHSHAKKVRFGIGTGFSDEQRRAYWEYRDQLKGCLVTFKYQKEGSKDAPRIPVFKGIRDRRDM